ncbi:trans-sulfuration enzyme family protein [Burkholderia pyrrocinia]
MTDRVSETPALDAALCGPSSRAIHLGQHEEGPAMFPVPPLVTHAARLLESFEDGRAMLRGEEGPNIAYQRYANPTTLVLEAKFRALEQCRHSLAVNSGMTASLMVFRALLEAGDHVMMLDQAFYETREQLSREAASRALRVTWIRDASPEALEAAYDSAARLVYIETPTNPTLRDVDLPAVAAWCASRNCLLVVDNTVLTPLGQNPLSLGAHLTLYSLTKHLNGHGDMVGGMICTHRPELYDKLKSLRDIDGLTLDPFSAWLAIRGLRTLSVRLQRHASNALAVTQMLTREYPGISWGSVWTTPYARRNGVSFQLNTGLMFIDLHDRSTAMRFVSALKLIRLAPTFGNLESLCYCHGGFADADDRAFDALAIPVGLVRLSIGLEDVSDLLSDIRQALDECGWTSPLSRVRRMTR